MADPTGRGEDEADGAAPPRPSARTSPLHGAAQRNASVRRRSAQLGGGGGTRARRRSDNDLLVTTGHGDADAAAADDDDASEADELYDASARKVVSLLTLPPPEPLTGASRRRARPPTPIEHEKSAASLARSLSVTGVALGGLAVGAPAAESQISLVFGADLAMAQLEQLAARGDSHAVALLDALEALDASSSESLAGALRFASEQVLPRVWGGDASGGAGGDASADDASLRNVEHYVVTRLVLSQIDVLSQQVLLLLDELTGHLAFWNELEGAPWRARVVGWAMRARTSRWRSVGHTVAYLADLQLMYLAQLGQLKELMQAFEGLESVGAVQRMTYVGVEQVAEVLELDCPRVRAPGAVLGALDRRGLLAHCKAFHGALAERRASLRALVAGLEEQPRHVKYWPEVSVALLAGAGLLVVGLRHQEATAAVARQLRESCSEFCLEHVSRPLAALVDEIVFDHTLSVADAQAMADAKRSLGRMLGAYLADKHPEMGREAISEATAAMDVSVLSERLEAEMKKPLASLVSGDMVRILLIQMQFLKKELLVVMSALDELIRENQFNLEVMATVPAFLVTWSVYQLGRQALRAVRGSKQTKSFVFAEVRRMLRDVEQLLNLNGSDRLLRGVTLGRLVLLLHQLESLVAGHAALFDRPERKRLAEDVAELASEELDIPQKLNTIARMHRYYDFLGGSPGRSLEALLHQLL